MNDAIYQSQGWMAKLGSWCNEHEPLTSWLLVITHMFCVYSCFFFYRATLDTHKCVILSSPQESKCGVWTKTSMPILFCHCCIVDAHSSSFSPSKLQSILCKETFVVSRGRSCSHGNILGVKKKRLLLGYVQGNRNAKSHSSISDLLTKDQCICELTAAK